MQSFLFSSLQSLPNTGDSLAKLLSRLINGNRVVDILYHQPHSFTSKKFLPLLYQVINKDIIITKVKVESHIKPVVRNQPFRVRCFCPSGYLTLTFFKTFPGYINKYFAIGSEIAVSGVVEKFNDELQISHPEYIFPAKMIDKIPKIEVIYPLTNGINQKLLRNRIFFAIDKIINPPEWISKKLLKKQNWTNWKQAITTLHNPNIPIHLQSDNQSIINQNQDLSLPNPNITEDNSQNVDRKKLALQRLAFDELLASQIANLITKKYLNNKNGKALTTNNILRDKLINHLPFQLTNGQKKVLAEIDQDLTSDKRMLRLLQGDVGSGKTIVAFLAMLTAVENKKQAVIICPITLLALQHNKNLQIFAKQIGIKIAILTSKTTKKIRAKILEEIKNGQINILIGTHAILEPDIIFKDLALIIIDEQHRFGVIQRMKLVEKGNDADVLLMSATPIPRSLMMTFYGDMDISILNEKPQDRIAIDTRVFSQNKEAEILTAICRAINNDEKIYWICPLIEKKDEDLSTEIMQDYDLSNVTAKYDQFKNKFGEEKVGLIHGKMKDKDKDKIMTEFIDGKTQILIATTVIEVGIDVKDASIIVIENCENFGLSQLHQLRGRVGRSNKQSYCILLYGKKLSYNGKQRLAIMKNSNDGFFIAEEDLKLRGSGEKLGIKQSGTPEYKIANLDSDFNLLDLASRYAKFLLEDDRAMINKESLKTLLKIFKYDECVKLIVSG